MSIIETCDAVAEKVKDLEVCFNDPDNSNIVVLTEILDAEQLAGVREGIISKIYENAEEAQRFLERLNRKPATINQKIEQAVQDMVQKPTPPLDSKFVEAVESEGRKCVGGAYFEKEVPLDPVVIPDTFQEPEPAITITPVESREMTVEDVKRMYHDEGMTVTKIAEFYGEKKTTLNNFIHRNGLSRTSYKKDDGFLDHAVEQRRKSSRP